MKKMRLRKYQFKVTPASKKLNPKGFFLIIPSTIPQKAHKEKINYTIMRFAVCIPINYELHENGNLC
jgi:hypothetical protein